MIEKLFGASDIPSLVLYIQLSLHAQISLILVVFRSCILLSLDIYIHICTSMRDFTFTNIVHTAD